MADLQKIIRAFETVDVRPASRVVKSSPTDTDGGDADNARFSFSAGANAKTFNASFSDSVRYYMDKQHKER